ncbi:hypothetical protein RHO14_07415 [Orbus wheelerorum]|uniref:hypothetical protein n=1 Tax=Orbus wheelerorum TaxID=3074111 RepID=UPI00370D585C
MTINLDCINGYLDAMRCLNVGPNHCCNYMITLLDNKGDFTQTLAHYFQSIPNGQGKYFDAALWHISPKQITVDEFIHQIDKWFFNQNYSPTVHQENGNSATLGFLDTLSPIALTKCYLYEIKTIPPIWYATRWSDLLLAHHENYYLLHFDLDD